MDIVPPVVGGFQGGLGNADLLMGAARVLCRNARSNQGTACWDAMKVGRTAEDVETLGQTCPQRAAGEPSFVRGQPRTVCHSAMSAAVAPGAPSDPAAPRVRLSRTSPPLITPDRADACG